MEVGRTGGLVAHAQISRRLIYEAPIWYTRLEQVNKDFIKEIIGESTLSSKELEDQIIDNTGATRDDIKKLLTWWFSSDVTIYLLKGFSYIKYFPVLHNNLQTTYITLHTDCVNWQKIYTNE